MAMVGQYEGAGRNGCFRNRSAGMEYYIQPGVFDGDRRQRYFQHQKKHCGQRG